MTPRRLALFVFGLVSSVACGKSRQERAFDELQTICNGLVAQGATMAQADAAMNSAQLLSGFRCPDPGKVIAPIGGTCPANSTDNPQCAFFFEWQSTDPGLCSTQGGCCFLCELRVMKGSITTTDGGASTPVCASRWLAGQFCQTF